MADVTGNNEPLAFHFSNSPLAALELDSDFRILRWSPRAETLFGWTEEQVRGLHPGQIGFIHPEDEDRVLDSIGTLIESRELRNRVVNRNLHRNGRVLHCEWYNSIRYDDEGKVHSLLCLAQDITERVKAEREREELLVRERDARREAENAREQFRSLFEAAPGGYLVMTPGNYQVVAVNNTYLRMTMRTRDEVLGRTFFELLRDYGDPEEHENMKRAIGEALAQVEATHQSLVTGVTRCPLRPPGGQGEGFIERYWSPIHSPVLDGRDRLTHIIQRVEDVTDYVGQRSRADPENSSGAPSREKLQRMEAEIVQRSRELERTNEQFRIAQRIGRLGGWEMDLTTGSVCWYGETYRLFGLKSGQFGGDFRSFIAFVHPDDRDLHHHKIDDIYRGVNPENMEYRIVRADGETRYLFEEMEVERDGAGDPLRISGIVQDITERKHHEIELHELSERFTATLESITEAFFMVDTQWRFLYVNREAERILGAAREQLLGRKLWSEFPRIVSTDIGARYRQAMAEGQPQQFEAWFAPWQQWFELRAYPSTRGLAVYFQDITRRKAYEDKLAEQAALLDQARDAITVRGMDHGIQFWNSGAEQMYGLSREEALGQSVQTLLYEDPEAFDEAFKEVLKKGSWKGQLDQTKSDGTTISVEAHWTLVRDKEGLPRSILAIETDITERLALEKQLRHAQRLEAVGQLTGGVAHDFNNLLTIILGNADFLMEDLAGQEEVPELVDMIRSAARRGADLTGRLLSVARQQHLEPRNTDLNALLEGAELLLRRTLNVNVELDFRPDPASPTIFADPAELESALLNLVINARDAMEGAGRIVVETGRQRLDGGTGRLHPDAETGTYAMLAVSDNGCGISPEHLERVLDPFFTTKEQGKGTGLGLSTVYGFVKQSGGYMDVRSEPGKGTRVELYFPATAEAGREAEADLNEVPAGRGERILVVEDDPLVLRHVERILKGLGYRTDSARDAREALAVLERAPDVDLMFTDVKMPGEVNGVELGKKVRQDYPGVSVLLTSGYARDALRELEDEGEEIELALLQKPYRRNELADMVSRSLQGKQGRDC